MTIGQVRSLAILVSLSYIPARILGVICVWSPVMAFTLALWQRAYFSQPLSGGQVGNQEFFKRACLEMLVISGIASIGFLCVLIGGSAIGAPNGSGGSLDAVVTKASANMLFGVDLNYSALPSLLRGLIDLSVTSLLTLLFSLLVATKQALAAFETRFPVALPKQAALVERGRANLRYDALLTLNSTLIFLVVSILVGLAMYALDDRQALSEALGYAFAPLFVFGGLMLFMLLIIDLCILRLYFHHPNRAKA